jgi:hypothetical protein
VDLDVRQAYVDLELASEQLKVARENRQLAAETLTQSIDRFPSGVTNSVEVAQSQETVASAEQDYKPEDKAETDKKDDAEKKPLDPATKRRRILIGAVAAVVVLGAGIGWWLYSRTYESADDAQINGHLNPIASRVAGTVKAVYVESDQPVKAGDALVDLDPSDYQAQVEQYRAQYQQALAQLAAQNPNVPITQTRTEALWKATRRLCRMRKQRLPAHSMTITTAWPRCVSRKRTTARARPILHVTRNWWASTKLPYPSTISMSPPLLRSRPPLRPAGRQPNPRGRWWMRGARNCRSKKANFVKTGRMHPARWPSDRRT